MLFAAWAQRCHTIRQSAKAWGGVRITGSSPDGGHHARPQYQECQQDQLVALGLVRNTLVQWNTV
jgi:hypothetical protein